MEKKKKRNEALAHVSCFFFTYFEKDRLMSVGDNNCFPPLHVQYSIVQ